MEGKFEYGKSYAFSKKLYYKRFPHRSTGTSWEDSVEDLSEVTIVGSNQAVVYGRDSVGDKVQYLISPKWCVELTDE